MDKEHEGQMIDGFRNDMKEKIKGKSISNQKEIIHIWSFCK